MQDTVNSSEEFVYRVCKKSFLSLWSYANPQGKDPRKELCDILVVCEPDIIIVSVKEIKITGSGDAEVELNRWIKRAIDASCAQVYGAERWLKSASHVVKKDGVKGLPLPSPSERRIHRVAVALGSKGKFPILYGDFGKGFVHVFDERSFWIILNNLDTISDFVAYLTEKETWYSSGVKTQFNGAEEDLLAVYLSNGKKFPDGHNKGLVIIGERIWTHFSSEPEYQAKIREDKDSYIWDNLIEVFCEAELKGNFELNSSPEQTEMIIRTLARENRLGRRVLGKSFKEFLELSAHAKLRSRYIPPVSRVGYVFLATPRDIPRQQRIQELAMRCLVARSFAEQEKCQMIIGIGTECLNHENYSFDMVCVEVTEWTEEFQNKVESIQKELGYFENLELQYIQEDEYPNC